MTKKNLLLTLTLPAMLLQAAQAQSIHAIPSVYQKHNPLSKYQHGQNAAAKTTDAASSRLVGIADMNNDGAQFQPTDTISFSYTGTRGGDLNHTLKYDMASIMYLNGNGAANSHYLQYFDANDNVTNSISQGVDTTGAYVNQYQTVYTYDSTTNNVASQVTQTWNTATLSWDNNTRDIYAYNDGGQLFSDLTQTWNTTSNTWMASSQYTLFYNVDGQLTSEIAQTYDVTTATWMYTNKYITTYDNSGNINTQVSQTWDVATNNWVNSTRNVYTYDDMNDNLTTLYQTWDAANGAWLNSNLYLYSDFVNMMPQTEVDQYWNVDGSMWVNSRHYSYAYNENNQLVYAVGESWNTGGFYEFAYGDPQSRYYYENFTLAVNTVSNKGGVASIFPVPTNDMLNINLKWDNAQAFNVAIFDMQGRVVKQWNVASTAQYNSKVSVSNFAAGNYIIKISGANGQIVQQLVVAH